MSHNNVSFYENIMSNFTVNIFILILQSLIFTVLQATTQCNISEFPHILKEYVSPKLYHEKSRKPDTRQTIEILVKNKTLILDLKLNEGLISKDYFGKHQENGRYRDATGINLCQYIGNIRNNNFSWAAISTCDGINGLIYDGKNYYEIRSYNEDVSFGTHILEKVVKAYNSISLVNDTEHDLNESCVVKQKRQKRSADMDYTNRGANYLELVLVLDYGVHIKLGNNKTKSYDYAHSIANVINGFYSKVNISVVLVGVLVWAENDEIVLYPGQTLVNFKEYCKENIWLVRQYDSAQLISAVSTHPTGIGVSYVNTICASNSVGVNDYLSTYMSTATTVSHEIGHNLGLNHDDDSCTCPERQCIMTTSKSMQTVSFSSCSIDVLKKQNENDAFYCLKNKPASIFSGLPICGNNIVEPGEDCDCGMESICNNHCCNATTCKLTENSTCATGECCNLKTCKLKSISSVCRESKNECDLPETCDGVTEHCPKDTFKLETEVCNNGASHCHQGFCPEQGKCKRYWGPGYHKKEECYITDIGKVYYDTVCNSNNFQSVAFTCDGKQTTYFKTCLDENYKIFNAGDKSIIITSRTFINKKNIMKCSLAMISNTSMTKPNITACDNIKINCTAVSKLLRTLSICPANCNGNGWCNNVGQCHCENHFGPPTCDGPGYGGSHSSGLMRNPTSNILARNIFLIFFVGIIPSTFLVYVFMSFYVIPKFKFKISSFLSRDKRTVNSTPKGSFVKSPQPEIRGLKVLPSPIAPKKTSEQQLPLPCYQNVIAEIPNKDLSALYSEVIKPKKKNEETSNTTKTSETNQDNSIIYAELDHSYGVIMHSNVQKNKLDLPSSSQYDVPRRLTNNKIVKCKIASSVSVHANPQRSGISNESRSNKRPNIKVIQKR